MNSKTGKKLQNPPDEETFKILFSSLSNIPHFEKVQLVYKFNEQYRITSDLIEGLLDENLLSRVTPKELEQVWASDDTEIREFVEKHNLLTTSLEKFQCTPEFETFKYNSENLQKLNSVTLASYYLFETASNDIPEIVEGILGEEDFDRYIDDLPKCRNLFFEQLLVQIVQILEIYIHDILKIIYNREIKKLIIDDDRKREKTIKYREIFDCAEMKDIHRLIIDEELSEHQSWDKIISIFNDRKKLNIKFDESGFSIRHLMKLIETRHVIIHRKGVVDKKYQDKTKDTDYAIGDRIRVTGQYYSESLDNITKLVQFIDRQVVERYY